MLWKAIFILHYLQDEAQSVIICESGFNELFPFLHPRFSPSVLCMPSPAKEEEEDREMKRERELSLFTYIYIYHGLHTLFEQLDLMGQ